MSRKQPAKIDGVKEGEEGHDRYRGRSVREA